MTLDQDRMPVISLIVKNMEPHQVLLCPILGQPFLLYTALNHLLAAQ